MKVTLRSWPRRRWLAAAVALPVMIALFGLTGQAGSVHGGTPWWIWPWLIVTGFLAAVALATYLAPPGAGKLIEVGCSPCAAAAAIAVAGAVVLHASAPVSPFMATMAVALTALALRQRLADARTCSTSPAVTARRDTTPPAP